MNITVIIPTFNEAETLPELVSALFELSLSLKLLIVDDNSPDGTGDIAEKLSVEHAGRISVLRRAGKLGLKTAYLEGFYLALADGADAIAQMDADLSHVPSALLEMSEKLKEADVVIGSRYVAGGSVDARWPLWRKALSAFGNFYARTILGLPLRDVTSGYRLWRRESLLNIPLEKIHSSGYIFLVEMLYMAHKLEYRFEQVPIYFADRRRGKSKMSLKIQLEAAVRVWQVKWLHRNLKPTPR